MAKAPKTAKQFALSHSTTYRLVDCYYSGSLLDGGGTACQNCGKIITHVGIVEDAAGDRYSVGMDCAETLSGLLGTQAYAEAKEAIDYSKRLRAALRRFFGEFAECTPEARVKYDPRAVPILKGAEMVVTTSEAYNLGGLPPGRRKWRNTYRVPAKYWEKHIKPMCAEFLSEPRGGDE